MGSCFNIKADFAIQKLIILKNCLSKYEDNWQICSHKLKEFFKEKICTAFRLALTFLESTIHKCSNKRHSGIISKIIGKHSQWSHILVQFEVRSAKLLKEIDSIAGAQ